MIDLTGYFDGGEKQENFHLQARSTSELMHILIDQACIYIYGNKNLCLPFANKYNNQASQYLSVSFESSNAFTKDDFHRLWDSFMNDLGREKKRRH
jgi:hypothetical protein